MTLSTQILNNYKHVFAGDPIIVKAITTASDIPLNATVPQFVVKVVANGHTHEIPQQFIPGDTLYVDVSSAFQSEYQLIDRQNEPDPTTVLGDSVTETYAPILATITAYVRYLINGTEYNGTELSVIDNLYVLRGGLSPLLRLAAQDPSSAVELFADNLSTKPNIPEVKNIGDTHISSSYDPSTHLVTTTANTVVAGFAIESVIPEASPGRHQIVYRNSLGVYETFSVFANERESFDMESEVYPILTQPDYSPSMNAYTQATQPERQYEMSTGFIPKAWAVWFIQEVLTATYTWIHIPILDPASGDTVMKLVAVHLEPSDKMETKDKTKAILMEVKFKVSIVIMDKS